MKMLQMMTGLRSHGEILKKKHADVQRLLPAPSAKF